MGDKTGACMILVQIPERKNHLEDLDADGRISQMHLQEVGWAAWTGLIWLRIGAGGGRW
jgi:hypothetical protein